MYLKRGVFLNFVSKEENLPRNVILDCNIKGFDLKL